MTFEWAKLADWLKLKPSIVLAVAISAAFAVFAPPPVLARLGLDILVQDHRGLFGAALVVSVALLLTLAAGWLFVNDRSPVVQWWHTRRLSGFLQTLSPPEKAILKQYLDGNTSTLYFQITDGVVSGLVQKRILWRASSVAAHYMTFPFNLQPWAWEYLARHKHLVQ